MNIEQADIIFEILEQSHTQYTIPVYQRNYEWSAEQCVKLFEDIINAKKNNRHHFCGSIIIKKLKEEKKITYNVLIDGQQRLTTIYILIKALIDLAQSEKDRYFLSEDLFNVDNYNEYGIDDASKLRLKPVKSDNIQLLLLMEGKKEQMNKASGIYQNYELFCKLITEFLQKNPDLDVIYIYRGLRNLNCALIKLDDKDNAQEIFERINSTGIPLSLADKVRNFVLMTDKNQDELYEEYWLKMEQLLGSRMGDYFYSFLNLKMDGTTTDTTAYEDFKALFREKEYTNEGMLKELLHYAEFYHVFSTDSSAYGAAIDKPLQGLRSLKQTTVYLFLFHVFDDFEAKVIDTKELSRVLNLLLAYTIRRLVCETGSSSLRGFYKTLYARVYSKEENKQHYYDALISFLQQLTSSDIMPSDEAFLTALKVNNLYRKNALCKYLLASIENQGKEQVKMDNVSIEHIMPQNQHVSESWKQMLGADWFNIHETYLHTLGNLTLTGYNSELSDKTFAEKKKQLATSSIHMTTLYADVLVRDVWDKDAMDAHAERLSQEIMKIFPVEQPQAVIKFREPGYQEYTCDDPSMATFKSINYYMFQGERTLVGSFAVMLRKLILQLYALDPEPIKAMAQNNEHLMSWSQNIMFSYDATKVSNSFQLKGTNIYESTGFPAETIVYIIRILLDRYGIDRTEFCYSGKPYVSDVYHSYVTAWCVKKAAQQTINYDPKYSTSMFTRFGTPYMDKLIPADAEKQDQWGTTRHQFYELVVSRGVVYLQHSMYVVGLSQNQKAAIQQMESILGYERNNSYHIPFTSDKHIFTEKDTAETIAAALDSMYDQLLAYEQKLKDNWQE